MKVCNSDRCCTEFFRQHPSTRSLFNFPRNTPYLSPVVVDARQDEEQPRPAGASLLEPAQPEYDGALVLLHHLDAVAEREGQRHEDQEEGDGGQQQGAQAGDVLRPRARHRRHCLKTHTRKRTSGRVEIFFCFR